MREMAQGSIIYAGDSNDWFPVESLGAANPAGTVNHINGYHYTRYIAITPTWSSDNLANSQHLSPTNAPFWQNIGLLYPGGEILNPHAFFCPLLTDPALNESQYQSPGAPFMSTAAPPDAAVVRSPYIFNPRLSSFTGNPPRKYNRTTDVHQLDVFMLDYINSGASTPDGTTSPAGVAFTSDDWAQWPSMGIEATFTDGSVRFCNLNVSSPVPGKTWLNLILTLLTPTAYTSWDQMLTQIQYTR